MGFSSTIKGRAIMGDLDVTHGTFDGSVSGNVTTGELDVGLRYVRHMNFLSRASAVGSDVVCQETLPGPGDSTTGLFTIHFDSGEKGTWMAYGKS